MIAKIKWNTENVVGFLLFTGLFIYPLFVSAYKVLNLSYFLSMVFLSLSLVLIWGFSGIFSFGQAAFFGIGGYVYAILTLQVDSGAFTPLALISGVVVAGMLAWILGYFMFYGGVNDVFVGLITLCVTLVLETFMAQTAGSEWKIGKVLLGGYNGINGIPTISIGSFSFDDNKFYYLILVLLTLTYAGLRSMARLSWGYTLIAVRENRERTQLFGYNVPKIQTMVFAAGGSMAALSGILYAAWGGYITPSSMGLTGATLPVVLVAAGGRKNVTAVMIFTLIYYYFSQILSASGSEYALVILGVALILVVLVVPEGIIVAIFRWIDEIALNRHKTKGLKSVNKESFHEERVS